MCCFAYRTAFCNRFAAARLGHAVATAQVCGAAAGLQLLVPLLPALPSRFPFGLIAQGDWLHELGRNSEARACYGLTLAEARNEAEAAFISAKLSYCDPPHLVVVGIT